MNLDKKAAAPSSFELHAMGQVHRLARSIPRARRPSGCARRSCGAPLTARNSYMLRALQIESGFFPTEDNLYCSWSLHHGSDWQVVAGVEEGVTQLASVPAGRPAKVVWNFPMDLTFKSTNVYGWPQLVLAVHGTDFL